MSCNRIDRVYRVTFHGQPTHREITDELAHAAKLMNTYGAVEITDNGSTDPEKLETEMTMRSTG